jgi:hypothetical protein
MTAVPLTASTKQNLSQSPPVPGVRRG